MVNLSKACLALHCMPNRFESFNTDDWDYAEMRSLYDFVFHGPTLKYSQSHIKEKMCEELGVARYVFDEVSNGEPLYEVLSLEAEGDNAWTTDELIGLVEQWNREGISRLLEFAQALTDHQAPIVWRWLLKHNWGMYERRFRKFLRLNAGCDESTPVDIALGRLYEDKELPSFIPLMAWKEGTPDKFWRINDAKSLYYYDTVYVRERNGSVNDQLTAFVVSNPFKRKERAWLWSDGSNTFSTLDDGDDVSLGEATKWLDVVKHDRPALLIECDGSYYLYTRGTKTLRVAIVGADTAVSQGEKYYQFDLAVMDGDFLTPVHTRLSVSVSSATPNLLRRLKQNGVILQRGSAHQKLEKPIVCDVVYTWSPSKDWVFTFGRVIDEAGIGDVDEYVDYMLMTGAEE